MVRWKERAIEQASREEWFFVSEVQPTDDPSLKGLWGLPAARPSLLDPGAGGFAHGKAQEVREDFSVEQLDECSFCPSCWALV